MSAEWKPRLTGLFRRPIPFIKDSKDISGVNDGTLRANAILLFSVHANPGPFGKGYAHIQRGSWTYISRKTINLFDDLAGSDFEKDP